MTDPTVPNTDYQPARPWLIAVVAFTVAAMTLLWPAATGQFLAGPHSDQYVAGYGFRLFGAEYFREFGHIPLWNPYLFAGLPYVAAMHGDIFYPTAWLRWVMPVDTAMNLGFAVHIVLAGCTMYAFLRAVGLAWGGAVVGGLAYELTGIVASLVHPGHDGKLFVSALTPLLFLAVLRAVRDRKASGFGLLALTVGLALHGHPQMSYYLLVAGGMWGIYLSFFAPDRPERRQLQWLIPAAVGAVALGFGIYAVQALPFYEYIPFSPRGEGGPSGGWDYATAFSMPVDELASLVLPEFNGISDAYWGSNFFKLHTEYVGVLPLGLALFGVGDRRRSLVRGLAVIGVLFLLVALGGHTPFYRLWYEIMPMMKKVRAPGMAFFLVAFVLSVFAAMGMERLLRREISVRRVAVVFGCAAGVALLGMVGVLQAVAQAIADPQMYDRALANGAALRLGSVRLLVLSAGAGVLLAAVARGRLGGPSAIAAVAALTVADLYSVDRRFFVFQPPAAETYRDDAITAHLRQTPMPYRTLDAGVYRGSWLMAHHVPTLLGYHGNELRWFDELMGGKNVWQNLGNPRVWDLFGVGYLIAGQPLQLPGWREVMGPVATPTGAQAWLYQAEPDPAYARVIPAAAKVPEAQIIPTLLDDRFPLDQVVLLPDSVSLVPGPIPDSLPEPVPASVILWQPGRMTLQLPARQEPGWLLVSENWYPDWTATVDGAEAPVVRGQFALITVPVPAGAREVTLAFRSRAFERGRTVSLLSLALALGLVAGPRLLRRRRDG